MSWMDTLQREIRFNYQAATTLMRMVNDDELAWKPETPEGAETTGWMTMGQLLEHMTGACGWMCQAFLTGQWRPEGAPEESGTDVMTLERMPASTSVAAAIEALEKDRETALEALREAGEERMANEQVTAPWGIEGSLGQQFLDSVKHLGQHKGQLFYYLKLLGRPVHTGHLWGMED